MKVIRRELDLEHEVIRIIAEIEIPLETATLGNCYADVDADDSKED